MDKDEALKMAIELMERFLECDGISSSDYIDVMNACKEALEQPAQEPVAWMLFKHGKKDSIHFNNPVDFNAPKEWWVENGYQSIPLYTRPAQPLSDDEIKAIDAKMIHTLRGEKLTVDDWIKEFARAIERAHGIGVKDD